MTGPRRIGFHHIAVLGFCAGTLVACGVKGELEPPPRVKQSQTEQGTSQATDSQGAPGTRQAAQAQADQALGATSSQTASTEAQPSRKVFTEQSSVKRVPRQQMIPRMPPPEWEKMKAEARKGKEPAPQPKAQSAPQPDKPFILDGLL